MLEAYPDVKSQFGRNEIRPKLTMGLKVFNTDPPVNRGKNFRGSISKGTLSFNLVATEIIHHLVLSIPFW